MLTSRPRPAGQSIVLVERRRGSFGSELGVTVERPEVIDVPER
jgi:hypothetical protein